MAVPRACTALRLRARRPAVLEAGGQAPGGAAPAGPSGQATSSPPAWGKVLLTTVQLWAQRRLHLRWPAQARWRLLTLLAVAALLFGAGAISIALTSSPAPAGHTRGATRASAGGAPTPAAIRAAAAARTAAARWIAGQASPDAIVSCDPQMCALLQAHGIPGGSCSRWAGAIPPRWAAT